MPRKRPSSGNSGHEDRSNLLLDAIRKAHERFITGTDKGWIFNDLLDILVDLTESEYGFLDEVLVDDRGQQYKLSLALSDISWDEGSRRLYRELVERKLEFRNLDNLAGLPVKTRSVVISNDPASDPRSGGTPEGHPPLKSFMGIPMFFGSELVGVAGVANRTGGYSEELADFLKPFISTCGAIISSVRMKKTRERYLGDLERSQDWHRKMVELLSIRDAALTAAANAIVITDREGIIQWANPAFTALTEYTLDDAVGRNPRDLVRSGLHDARYYKELWETIIGGDVWRGEITNRTKSGVLYIEEMTITPVRASGGEISHFVAVKQDITRRKIDEGERQSLYLRQQRYAELLAGIVGFGNSPGIDTRRIIRDVITGAAVMFGVSRSGVWMFGEGHSNMRCFDQYESAAKAYADHADEWQAVPVEYTDLLKRGRVIASGDVHADTRTASLSADFFRGRETVSMLDAPVYVRGRLGAVLRFENTGQPKIWRQEEEQIAMTLAAYIGGCLESDERKLAESRLEEQKVFIDSIMDAIPAPVFYKNTEGVYIGCNSAFSEFIGVSRGEIIGKNVYEVAKKEFAEISHRSDQDILSDGVTQKYEAKVVYNDGSLRDVIFNKAVFRSSGGEVRGIVGVMLDITERRMIEDDLRRSKERLIEAQRIAHVGSWSYSFETHKREWSEEMFRIYGFQPNGATPSDEELEAVHHPDDRENFKSAHDHAGLGSGPYEKEIRVTLKDGSTRYILIRSNSQFGPGGVLMRMYGTAQDITERKKFEQLILSSLREKEILLKEIHHRVKNNFQVISSLLGLQCDRSGVEAVKNELRISCDRVRAMAMVHEQLYRSEDLSKINFAVYIEQLVNELQFMHEAQRQRIQVQIRCDPVKLGVLKAVPCGLVINELVTNSIKYAFKGKKDDAHTISIEMNQRESSVSVTIADNGTGLPDGIDLGKPETLGLTLVAGLVKQMDGTLEVRVDGGTAYTIRFPM